MKFTIIHSDITSAKHQMDNNLMLSLRFFFQIKKLSRWEVIDVVRTMSTEQAKAGQEGNQIVSF